MTTYLSNVRLYSSCGNWQLFQFLIYTQSVGLLGSARRKAATYKQKHINTE
jgi:hypothetical protein